jgi:hypothetical protein
VRAFEVFEKDGDLVRHDKEIFLYELGRVSFSFLGERGREHLALFKQRKRKSNKSPGSIKFGFRVFRINFRNRR